MAFEVDESAAAVIRDIFRLYNEGWGYKKIANHLTDLHIPTPRSVEVARKEALGEETKLKAKATWSIVTVQGILENDFYIGTLRQGKYARKRINGSDIKKDECDHIVFERHHPAIVDDRTFALAQEGRKKRSTSCYRGIKINDNVYSGFLFCGDCGAPLFSMSRRDLRPAYTCSSYHKRGLKGCTSHHTRVDVLDALLKDYVGRVKDSSADMLERLNDSLKAEGSEVKRNEETADILQKQLDSAWEELKATKRQRVRDIMKHPEKEEILEQTYDELEAEAEERIAGLKNQIALTANKRNTIIQVNRIARTALELFDEILAKDKLDRADLELLIEKILVYENRMEIQLKADIDQILKSGTLCREEAVAAMAAAEEDTANFKIGIVDSATVRADVDIGPYNTQIVQSSPNRRDKVYDVSVISDGDPLEIYTSREGEVIFKKYSLLGGVEDFASDLCETMSRSTGCICAVTDRDAVIAVAGGAKRELLGKRIAPELEQIMESRKIYHAVGDSRPVPVTESSDKHTATLAAPILSEGDLLGLVLFVSGEGTPTAGEAEFKLAQTIAAFLGRHMES